MSDVKDRGDFQSCADRNSDANQRRGPQDEPQEATLSGKLRG